MSNNQPRYSKCLNCYWRDNCPMNDMDDLDIHNMKMRGKVNPKDFANFENCEDYYEDYCEDYTPLEEDFAYERAMYERELKERFDYYQDLVDEQQDQ